MKFMAENIGKILKTDGFLSLSKVCLLSLLSWSVCALIACAIVLQERLHALLSHDALETEEGNLFDAVSWLLSAYPVRALA